MLKFDSLKNKLRILMTTMVLLAVLIASFIFYVFSKAQLYEKYINTANSVLDHTNLMLDNIFSDAESGINILEKRLSTSVLIDEKINNNDLDQLLSTIQENIKNSNALFLGLDDGVFYLYPKRYILDDYDPRNREWYLNSLKFKEDIIWSKPYVDCGTGKLTITGSKYVNMDNSDHLGVIGIDILLSELSKTVQNVHIGNNGFIFVTDDSGDIIAHPNDTYQGKLLSEITDESDKIMALEGTIYKNKDYTYIGRYFKSCNFHMIAVVDNQELQSILNHIIRWIILGTFLFILGSKFIVFRLADEIVKPIEKLKSVMLTVEKGNYDIRCDIKAEDEIQTLIDGFNNMIGAIKEKNNEMQALYEELYASEETLHEQYDSLLEQSAFIRKSENRYKLIFDASKEGLWDTDENWNITYLTPNWYLNYFETLDDNNLKTWQSLIHPEDIEHVNTLVENHIANKTNYYKCEYRVLALNGQYRWIEAIGKAQFNNQGNYMSMSGSHLDITKRKEYELRILDMAYHDYLTNINNQLYLREHLKAYLESGGCGSILFIDLDNFKNVNDTYGHTMGDIVLTEISKRLIRVAQNDFIVSRFSSDEFVILIKDIIEVNKIIEITELILNEIKKLIVKDALMIKITASVGITMFPEHGTNVDALLQNADIAMLQAKKTTHKEYYIFDDMIKTIVLREMQLEHNMRSAVEKNEIILYYQPIIDMDNLTIKGFEALARWQSLELGLINPDDFIPIAEKSGLINEIGYKVLKMACHFLISLDNLFDNQFEISVNISVVQLTQDYFVDEVIRIIDDYHLDYSRIILEITETIMFEKDEKIIEKLVRLHNKGINISLDDFGTGYSSLNNLIKLPLDYIKIDKSIMTDSIYNEHVFSLLESIVKYAHKMNLVVVGEGIEDDLYIQKSKELLIDYAQGYYFSKPIAEVELIELIRKYQA